MWACSVRLQELWAYVPHLARLANCPHIASVRRKSSEGALHWRYPPGRPPNTRAGASRAASPSALPGEQAGVSPFRCFLLTTARPCPAGPAPSSSIPRWGRYAVDFLTSTPSVQGGSGPWAGSYYVSDMPLVEARGMWIHSGLDSGGPMYPIPDSVTICGLSNVLVGVHALNTKCKTVGVLEDFEDSVVAHENEHQNSGNRCILHVNRLGGPMAQLEATVGGDYDEVRKAAEKLWNKRMLPALDTAFLTNQSTHWSDGDAHQYHNAGWLFGRLGVAGHSGTDGCPQI